MCNYYHVVIKRVHDGATLRAQGGVSVCGLRWRDERTVSVSRPQPTLIHMAVNEGFYEEDKSLPTSFL